MLIDITKDQVYSREVMVKITLDLESVVQVQTFIYEHDPKDRVSRGHDKWVREHILESYSLTDIKQMFQIKEEGIYQIIAKVRIHGWWAGWEIQEYDEEMEINDSLTEKMPDDWFGVGGTEDA